MNSPFIVNIYLASCEICARFHECKRDSEERSTMAKEELKEIQELMKLHKQFFGAAARKQSPLADYESLEQPYAGEIVQTVTTYSVYDSLVPNIPKS